MEKKPTTAAEYRKEAYKLLTLPSGNVFKVRKPDIFVMAEVLEQTGVEIPTELKRSEVGKYIKEQMSQVDLKKALPKVISVLLPACCVEPKVALEANPDKNVLAIHEIDPSDAIYTLNTILDWVGMGRTAQKLKKFR